MAYDAKAQEFAYGFFAKGWSKERALKAIRREYPGLSGSTWDTWVESLGWKERRAAADARLRELEELAQNAERELLPSLDELRQTLWVKVKADPNPQAVYAYNAVVRQIADLAGRYLAKKDRGRLALEVIQSTFERLLTLLRDDAELAKALAARAGVVGKAVEKVAEEFGAEG